MPHRVENSKVLLVEDNPSDAYLISEHLADAARESEISGISVVHAKNLTEAKDFFENDGGFDVVLVDLTLPETSGLDTVRRSRELFGDCPLVVLTGYDDIRFALDALQLGAQDYLIKGHETGLSIIRSIMYALERQRMVSSIESSEKRYRSLIDNSPNAILLLEEFQIVLANREALRLLGADREELVVGHEIFSFMDQEAGVEQIKDRLTEAADESTPTPRERIYRTPQGEKINVEETVSRIVDDDRSDRLLVVATDITEKKRIEEQLIHSRRMATMGELAAGIAHEISQPLNVIRIAAGMVEDSIANEEDDPDFVSERAGKILAQVQRASKVINHLRTFVRKSESQPDLFDPNLAIAQAFEMMEQRLRLGGAHSRLELTDQLPQIRGDQNSLEQVIINLIANSLDAFDEMEPDLKLTRGSCLLTVESGTETNGTQIFAILRFQDNGPGMPEQVRSQIFDPFFTTKKAGHGTGLGLSVCMNIIRDHSGTMHVMDTGKGTLFEIRLPAGTPRQSARAQATLATIDGKDTHHDG